MSIFVPSWESYPPFPGSITLVTPPEATSIGPDMRGRILRIQGHFNDPRSADCVIAWGEGAPAPPDGSPPDLAAEWYCREQFVVTAWEAIGTDPSFEPLVPG